MRCFIIVGLLFSLSALSLSLQFSKFNLPPSLTTGRRRVLTTPPKRIIKESDRIHSAERVITCPNLCLVWHAASLHPSHLPVFRHIYTNEGTRIAGAFTFPPRYEAPMKTPTLCISSRTGWPGDSRLKCAHFDRPRLRWQIFLSRVSSVPSLHDFRMPWFFPAIIRPSKNAVSLPSPFSLNPSLQRFLLP